MFQFELQALFFFKEKIQGIDPMAAPRIFFRCHY